MTIIVWDGEGLATDRQAIDGSHKRETDKAWYISRGDTIYIVSGVGLLKNIINVHLKKNHRYKDVPMRMSVDALLEFAQDNVKKLVASKKGKKTYWYIDKRGEETYTKEGKEQMSQDYMDYLEYVNGYHWDNH